MTYYEEDDVDDLRTWEDVEFYLGEPWRQVRGSVTDIVLTTFFDELLVEEPAAGTARQRRRLHRLGCRRRGDRCWAWTPPVPPPVAVPSPSAGLPAFFAAGMANMRRGQAVDRARCEMAVRVLREVYECAPEHLVVTLFHEAEDDAWEDEDMFDTLDCAAREARFGPGHGSAAG